MLSESRLRKIEARVAARAGAVSIHTPPIPPRYRWLRWLAAAAVLYAVFLGVIRVWWNIEAKARFDVAVARYRALGQPVLIEDFREPQVPQDQNGGPLIASALQHIALSNSDDEWLRFASCDLEATRRYAARLRPILDDLHAAGGLAEEGLGRPHFQWGPPLKRPLIDILYPELSGTRQLARYFSVRALLSAAEGDPAAALADVDRVIRMAEAVRGYSPSTIGHLVSIAIDAVAAYTLMEIAPDLPVADGFSRPGAASREQVRALIATLLNDRAAVESLERAMCYERLFQIDVAISLFDRSAGLQALTSSGTRKSGRDSLESQLFGPMFLLDGVKVMEWTNGLILAAGAVNWPAARAVAPPPPSGPSLVGLSGLSRLLSAILLPSQHRAIELHYRALAQRRMAAVALAIRLYQSDHGRLPESLDLLVPGYLPFVPRDPFAATDKPLGYVPEGPWLYSVNSDGVDDGGVYALNKTGGVELNAADLVFFLTREYPRGESMPPEDPKPPGEVHDEVAPDGVSADTDSNASPSSSPAASRPAESSSR